jgi:hypothetical protein
LLSSSLLFKIWRNVLLPVVLYGYVKLREEYRMRTFEDRVLKGLLGPKREEVNRRQEKIP